MRADHLKSSEDNQPQSEWLLRLCNAVTSAMESEFELPPMGCHVHCNEDSDLREWEVTIFVSGTEIFGGEFDGQLRPSRFMLDLSKIMPAFDVIDSFYWQAQTMADDDQIGPHIGVTGQLDGQTVWLRVTSETPAEFPSGQRFDALTETIENRW